MSIPHASAYPRVEEDQRHGGQHVIEGLTKLEYFAAHAPAEPQTWFQPTMPTAKPEAPKRPSDLNAEEVAEMSGWRDWLDIPDLKQPRVHAYAVAATEHRKALAAWEREAARLRLVQWPCAWAEAVLETLP